jgi:uncharacterized membrane protein
MMRKRPYTDGTFRAMNEPLSSTTRWCQRITLAAFAAMALLALLWELWWAPLRPGGSLLALKALPLLIALPFLARGHLRAYQWWSMLLMLYLCEGLVRMVSDPSSAGRWLGGLEAALATLAFVTVVTYVRMASRARQMRS